MDETPSLGRLIDSLGFTQEPRPDEDVVGAIVLLKVRDPDGGVGLRSLWTDDLGWLERVGMHTVAAQAELPSSEDDEDTWLDEETSYAPLRSVETGPDALGEGAATARGATAERRDTGLGEHNA